MQGVIKKVEGLDYFGKKKPVLSWTTVRLMLSLSINQGWATRQMDFSNAFVQDNLVEDVYLSLMYYSDSDTGEDRDELAMKLNKSLYIIVQSPLYCYNFLKGFFEGGVLKPSPLDPCMFYGRGIIALMYLYGVLLFGTGQDNIDEGVKELEYTSILLTVEDYVYDFLGVEVKTDNQ